MNSTENTTKLLRTEKKSLEMLTGKLKLLSGTTYLIMEKDNAIDFESLMGLLEFLERTFLGRVLLSMLPFILSLIQPQRTNEKTSTSSTKTKILAKGALEIEVGQKPHITSSARLKNIPSA